MSSLIILRGKLDEFSDVVEDLKAKLDDPIIIVSKSYSNRELKVLEKAANISHDTAPIITYCEDIKNQISVNAVLCDDIVLVLQTEVTRFNLAIIMNAKVLFDKLYIYDSRQEYIENRNSSTYPTLAIES